MTNQSPSYSGFNAYDNDPLLKLVSVSMSNEAKNGFKKLGAWAGSADAIKLGALANQNPPVLHTHDAKGERLDQVEYHPAWHALMRKGVDTGLHCSIWREDNVDKGHRNLARAIRMFISGGVESGHLCPMSMTNASVGALVANQNLLSEWQDKILSPSYDPSHKPVADKRGVTLGMAMTERQGGSDVRSLQTVASPLQDGIWRLNGSKWFVSAPMCDAFLVLAKTENGVSSFMMPRILPDGEANGMRIQRLKDKLGNRSNASSEIELHDALAYLVGEEGKGIPTIMEMVTLTRLDCSVFSGGLMHTSLAEAVHHTRHRSAFGKKLIDQPLMERVLADMSLDAVAASALTMRLATAFDRSNANPQEAAYVRLMTPVIKYWTCKIAPALVGEALECLGGNGYVETGNLARHYREAPLNGIWEGAGNIMCLDLIRVLSKSRNILDAVLDGLQENLGGENASKAIDVIRTAAKMTIEDPGSARILIEQLALTAAAAELTRLGAGQTAQAFIETRLGGLWRNTYGMLDTRYNSKAIIEKNFPAW
jgi:putative acyl-CoA dehydrogenase